MIIVIYGRTFIDENWRIWYYESQLCKSRAPKATDSEDELWRIVEFFPLFISLVSKLWLISSG